MGKETKLAVKLVPRADLYSKLRLTFLLSMPAELDSATVESGQCVGMRR